MARLYSLFVALVVFASLALPGTAAAARWHPDPNVGWDRSGCCCCGGRFFFQYGFGLLPPTFPAPAYYTAPAPLYAPPAVTFTPAPPSLGPALGNGCRAYTPMGAGGLGAQARGKACPLANGSWRITN